MSDVKIYPSVVSCDLAHLADEVHRLEQSGVDGLHVDIMDGHFVPNLTFGPAVVASINRSTSLFLDVHLMMYNCFDYIERFVEAGADSLTIHFEATEDVEDTLEFIHRCGVRAGLSFSPETSMELIPKFIPHCDYILLMTVHPGFSGQKFIPEVLEKVRYTRYMSNLYLTTNEETKKSGIFDIQVDGGIDLETAKQAAHSGANVFVSASYILQASDTKKAVHDLREIAEKNFCPKVALEINRKGK